MDTATGRTQPRRAWVEQIMGLPVSLHLRGPGLRSAAVTDCVAAVFDELRVMDALFSTYRPDSEISRLNRGELELAECDPAVRTVSELCEQARVRTGGHFNARWLPLPTGGFGFDPSGLVKGWAVERAARHLIQLTGCDHFLNAGGDVVLHAVGGQPWRVGVEDPAEPGRLRDVLALTVGAVATSGTTHRGQHIVDPDTGGPAGRLRAATVTGPRLLWADVYATAAVAGGPTALDWLADIAGYEAMLVDAAGHVRATPGWPGSGPSPGQAPENT